MDRRSFLTRFSSMLSLLGITSLVAPGLTSCTSTTTSVLHLYLLRNSLPALIPQRFKQFLQQKYKAGTSTTSAGFEVQIHLEAQLDSLFQQLQKWQRQGQSDITPKGWWPLQSASAPIPSSPLVLLGDYWLEGAIRQELIQPMALESLPGWAKLPQSWQNLVRRDAQGASSTSGQLWAAPYRWGTTIIAYRADRFRAAGWPPITDWADLWRPELKGHISLLDQPREVIGLVLKKLGHSYNTANLEPIPNLRAELQQLHQQAKFYSSTHYLQPLVLEDTWVAVGWSSDIMPLIKQDLTAYGEKKRRLVATVPRSGTALWADLWVKPKQSFQQPIPASDTLWLQWIDFCWQPEIATQLSLLSQATSPIVTTLDAASLPEALRNDPLLLPAPDILARSEFLAPLSQVSRRQYQDLWQTVRGVVSV